MKKLAICLGVAVLLSGCVAYAPYDDGPYYPAATVSIRGSYHHDHHAHDHRAHRRHDRDGDGVPNRHDRRPRNPHRY